MSKRTKRAYARTVSSCALVCSAILLLSSPSWAEEVAHKFDIPAESTARALNDLSTQSGIQILFPYDVAAKTTASAIKGSYSLHVVLKQLLSGSGLEIASETDKTITLRAASSTTDEPRADAPTEVIVTGSHIRGGNPTSPVHVVDRKEIDRSGYSQIGDVIRSLPENFSGGQNPGVIAASSANLANNNDSNASTVNLRGLGTDATLVLLNGHRLSADSFSQGSDISGIPLAALQRVEIVPDGASALYGSDAVAGVVNFILRKNYTGAEVSARLGGRTAGGGEEQTYSALGGVLGLGWYALANIEHSHQAAITAEQLDLVGASPVSTLLQKQDRNSLFVSTGRDLSDTISVSFDGLVADRTALGVQQPQSYYPVYVSPVYVPSYSLAANLDIELPHGWKTHVVGVASGSRNSEYTTIPAEDYSSGILYKNYLRYIEATADGTAFHLPSGDVKVAVGAGYRHEGFQSGTPGTADAYGGTRDVSYAFAESLIPLVSPSDTRVGLQQLELSVSARAENYNDFGSTTNPRLGLRYVPFEDLTVRATWGKSFKAPSFLQAHQQSILYLWDETTLGGAGSGTALLTYGGNPNLKPEKSTSWTLGTDYRPAAVPGLVLSATYFDIDYTDRVVQPVSVFTTALSNPIYAPFVEGPPTAAYQAELLANNELFYNYSSGAYDPTKVVAVVRDAYENATSQTVRGLDLSYRQSVEVGARTLSLFANATWSQFKQQTILTAPVVTLSGTIFNTPKFKARGGLTWQDRGLTATAIANYISDETDTGVIPNASVASWTTVDTTIAYAFGDVGKLGRGIKLSLAVSNLFDKKPPRAVSPALHYGGVYFDSTNASIIGRFASLTLSKAW